MKIILINDCGGVIGETHYDTDDATEAMKKYVNDGIFDVGDTIQIKED